MTALFEQLSEHAGEVDAGNRSLNADCQAFARAVVDDVERGKPAAIG
jgi:hypothetical protein